MLRKASSDRDRAAANAYVRAAVAALACGRPVPEPPEGADWVRCAAAHGVQPVLESALSRRDRGDRGAPPAQVRASRLAVVAQHERVTHDLAWARTTLDGTGRDWAVFKGPVLAWELYADPDARWFSDLDVLVRPADFGTVIGALEARGAVLIDHNWEAARRLGVAELSLRLPRGTVLDLHWHLVNRPNRRSEFALHPAGTLDRRRWVRLRGLDVPTLDELDTILYLGLHGALGGGHLLRWLLDLQQAVRALHPDPVALDRRGREQGTALLARVMLDRAARYVDPGLAELARHVAAGMPWAAVARAWSRHFPPGTELDGGLSGRALPQTVGRTSLRSARALLADSLAPEQVHRLARAALRRPLPAASGPEALTRRGPRSAVGRAEYLAQVAGEN